MIMWYEIAATWESGKTYKYQKEGMIEAMKMVARLKATAEVCYCSDHLVDIKITKVVD